MTAVRETVASAGRCVPELTPRLCPSEHSDHIEVRLIFYANYVFSHWALSGFDLESHERCGSCGA